MSSNEDAMPKNIGVRTCRSGKVGWHSRKIARKAARRCTGHGRQLKLTVYRCPACSLFHLTSCRGNRQAEEN